MGLLLVVSAAAGVDVVVISSRIQRVAITFPGSDEGTTWVLVGSDARADVPGGPDYYGTTAQAPGVHADAVIVVHQFAGRTTVLSIPRDVLVSPANGAISRLALTLDNGPQALVDGLCRSLQIPASHLVIITMKAFAATVNALGGVTVTNAVAVRDTFSGLNLPPGRVRLTGVQALALVRSRHPQTLTTQGWVAVSLAMGDIARTTSIGAMFRALATKSRAQRDNPLGLQRIAWALTAGLTTDSHTGLFALAGLHLGRATAVDLPVQALGATGVGASAGAATTAALAAAGYTRSCQL